MIRLSKSRFVAGVQCLKRLYLQVHHPELSAELDDSAEALLEEGNRVGLEAQRAFPGGVLVTCDHHEAEEALRRTAELVRDRSVPAIFEAAFQADNCFVRVDVLKRETENSFRLWEVKSSTALKDRYRYDIGIQEHVVTRSGLKLVGAGLMHLNREYIYAGGEFDRGQLFSSLELTPDIAVPDEEICFRVKEQLEILSKCEPPKVTAGPCCTDPMICEFFDQCNPPVPEHHISFLPRMSGKTSEELVALGITSIHDIPDSFPLSAQQRIACDAVKSGQTWIDPGARDELSTLQYPLCFMDFETVYPALPRFPGLRPYDHVPFQWSVHRIECPDAEPHHFEFLAKDASDPRLPFVGSLIAALHGAATVVVYNEGFELSRLRELSAFLPDYAEVLSGICDRVWDMLPFIRRNVYHPGFSGSYSLKAVLPALVPELTYQGMKVAHGGDAVLAYEKLTNPAISSGYREHLRNALLEYCGLDTMALVQLFRRLTKNLPKQNHMTRLRTLPEVE